MEKQEIGYSMYIKNNDNSTSDALRNATSGSSVPACIESRSSLHNK